MDDAQVLQSVCDTAKVAYSPCDRLIGNIEKTCSGCCQQNVLKVVPADQGGLCEDERLKLCRAACKASATLQACKPDSSWCLFTETACPGIVIIEDSDIGRMLVAKNICLRFRILIHVRISVEMVRIYICHDSHRWTQSVGS